jgi:putative ABC transport system permease protein
MKLLNRLTLKSLKLNKKRTAVTIVGVLLATAMITTVSILLTSARSSMIAYETEQNGKFHYAFENVDSEALKYIRENRQVESWYVLKDLGYANLPGSKNEYKPYLRIIAADGRAFTDCSLKLVEGRMPENEGEIVISKHIRSNGGVDYKVGDKLSLDIGKRKAADGFVGLRGEYFLEDESLVKEFHKDYTVVGVIERPNMKIEPYSEAGYSVFTYLEDKDIGEGADVYVYYTKTGVKNRGQITQELENACGPVLFSNGDLLRYEVFAFSSSIMRMLACVATIVILIIMFTSIFCIRNSFAISITEKMKQYGMLASIGATSKQIRKNVFFEAAFLALIGIPLGVLSGVLASYILILVCNRFFEQSLSLRLIFSVSILPILAAVMLSYVTILISARRSASRAAKVSPMEAIRGNEEIVIREKKIRSPKWVKRWFGIGGELADKNLRRSRKKYRTTVVSIVVSVSLFIAMWSFIHLAFGMVGYYYEDMSYNIGISLPSQELQERMKGFIEEHETVERYAMVREIDGEIPAENLVYSEEYLNLYDINENDDAWIPIVSLGEKEYSRYLKELGLDADEAEGKAVLYSMIDIRTGEEGKEVYRTIPMYGYQEGDVVKYRIGQWGSEDDEEDIRNISFEVAAVSEERPMGLDNTYVFFVVSDETLEEISGGEWQETGVNFHVQAGDADRLAEDLQKEFETDRINVDNRDERVRQEKSLYILFAIFLYGFIGVISLIGVTNIFNTITTNMELRSREFAMLKSIGMTKREFNRMIRLESLFYGGKSLLIGVPIGIALSLLIYRAFAEGAELGYSIPWGGIAISAAAVMVLVAGIMRYSLKRINKQNIIDTIRNENI